MPTYDYRCHECGHLFEETKRIADSDVPTEEPCPSCGASAVKREISAVKVVGMIGSMQSRLPGEAREHLQRIKEKNYGSKMPDYS